MDPAETLSVERFYDAYGRPTRTDSYNIGVRDAGLANLSQALVQRWFGYDELGRLTSDAINVGGHSLTTHSSWSSVDHRWVQDVYYPTAVGTVSGMIVTRRFDGQGRVDRHEVGYMGLSSPSQVSTRWSGSRIVERQHRSADAEYDEAAQYDAFGARTRWAYGRGGLDVYAANLERDILSRVRSAHTMFGTASGPAYRWQGFLYDTRHHLTTEYEAEGVSSPPSVGVYGQATNASVGGMAEGTLQASATQRTRETNVGATLEIRRDQQPVWQAQVPGLGGGVPTVARGPGHRLVDVMVDEATYSLG